MKQLLFLLTIAFVLLSGCSQKHVEPVLPQMLTVDARAIQQDQHIPSKVFFDAQVQGGLAPYSFEWTFGENEGISRSAQPDYTYITVGTFRIVCKVKSSDNQIVADTLEVTTIPHDQLVAIALAIPPKGQLPFTATLLGQANGGLTPYAWSWTKMDGDFAQTQNTTFTPTSPGTTLFVLTVTSADGQIASDTVEVTATTDAVGNLPPVAVMTMTPLNGVVDSTVFSGSAKGSYDPDGVIRTYAWDFGDGFSAMGETVTHVYHEAGLFHVTLCVTDDSLAMTCVDGYVQVTSPPQMQNKPPVNIMTVSPISGIAGQTVVSYDGSGSHDSDGVIVSSVWTFGDGTTAQGLTATHVYADSGFYEVAFTVTDDKGASVTERRWVLMSSTGNPPHIDTTCWRDTVLSLEVTSKPSLMRKEYTLHNPPGVFYIALKIYYEKPNQDLVLGFEAKYNGLIQSEVIADPKPGITGNYTAIVILNGQYWMTADQTIAFTFQAGPNGNKAKLLGVYACTVRESLLDL